MKQNSWKRPKRESKLGTNWKGQMSLQNDASSGNPGYCGNPGDPRMH